MEAFVNAFAIWAFSSLAFAVLVVLCLSIAPLIGGLSTKINILITVALTLLVVLGLCSCDPTIKFYSIPSAVFVHETDAERFIGEQTEIVIIKSEKENENE